MTLYTDHVDNFRTTSQAAVNANGLESRASWAALALAQAEMAKAEQMRIKNIVSLSIASNLSLQDRNQFFDEARMALHIPEVDE